MAASYIRRQRPPLDAEKLDELGLSYVSRFATSRAKLIGYLSRKLRERGWSGDAPPPVEELADRLTRLGYVDDRAYALAKARSLSARGYGRRRVQMELSQAGIGEQDSGDANELARTEAYESALRYARRRAIGPYAAVKADPRAREKAIAAMIRAGHDILLARTLVDLAPGEFPDCEEPFNGG